MVKRSKSLSPQSSEIWITNMPVVTVLDGNMLSSGLLPYLERLFVGLRNSKFQGQSCRSPSASPLPPSGSKWLVLMQLHQARDEKQLRCGYQFGRGWLVDSLGMFSAKICVNAGGIRFHCVVVSCTSDIAQRLTETSWARRTCRPRPSVGKSAIIQATWHTTS